MDLRLLVLPAVGGLIGWFTNYLAVKMLFRPRRPIRVVGCRLQGLVPKRRAELARRVGELVERELVSHRDVHAALANDDFLQSLRPRLEDGIDTFIRERVIRGSVWLRVAFSTGAAMKLKRRMADEVMALLPDMVSDTAESLKDRLRFRELVRSRIEAFELERLEKIVAKVAGRELRAIEFLGGIIGFAIGLVQMAVILVV
jgi:uncharacterized membrane protein YheB (UPF0754 family)